MCNYVANSEVEFYGRTGGPPIAGTSYVLRGGKSEL